MVIPIKFKLFPGLLISLWGLFEGEYEICEAVPFPKVQEGTTVPGKRDRYIVCKNAVAQITYQPLRRKRLHRQLVKLQTDDDILEFVKEHGFLNEPVMVFPPAGGESLGYGEKLADWYDLIRRLRVLLHIWGLIEQGSPKLEEIVIWNWKLQRVNVDLTRLETEIGTFDRSILEKHKLPATWVECLADAKIRNPYLWKQFSKNRSHSEVANYFLCRQITKKLEEGLSLVLLPFENNRLLFQTATLESAIWYHFALEVSGPFASRICGYCGKMFTVRDRRQRFCDKKCRQNFWYHAKKGKPINLPEGGEK